MNRQRSFISLAMWKYQTESLSSLLARQLLPNRQCPCLAKTLSPRNIHFHNFGLLREDDNFATDVDGSCGRFRNGVLEGLVTETLSFCERDNVSREVFYKQGVRHGFYRYLLMNLCCVSLKFFSCLWIQNEMEKNCSTVNGICIIHLFVCLKFNI